MLGWIREVDAKYKAPAQPIQRHWMQSFTFSIIQYFAIVDGSCAVVGQHNEAEYLVLENDYRGFDIGILELSVTFRPTNESQGTARMYLVACTHISNACVLVCFMAPAVPSY